MLTGANAFYSASGDERLRQQPLDSWFAPFLATSP